MLVKSNIYEEAKRQYAIVPRGQRPEAYVDGIRKQAIIRIKKYNVGSLAMRKTNVS
jgi:hypothetical protein